MASRFYNPSTGVSSIGARPRVDFGQLGLLQRDKMIFASKLANLDLQPIGPAMLAAKLHQVNSPLAGRATKEGGATYRLWRVLYDKLKGVFGPRARMLDVATRHRHDVRGRVAINVPARYPERA